MPISNGLVSVAYSIADQSFSRTKSLGILNLSLQLGAALSSRPDIPTLEFFSNSSLQEWNDRFGARPVHCFDRACATRLGRILWDQDHVYREAGRRGMQWLVLPKGFASFSRTTPVKVAAYVHDTIGEWYRERYPGAFSRTEAWYFRYSLLATLRQAAVVFTNSEFTRRELLAMSQRHAIEPPDIVVAGIGFDPVSAPAQSDRDRIVVLANPLKHKRTDLAVRFMSAWQEASRFAGRVDWVGRFPAGVNVPSHPRWAYHERLDEAAYRALLAESRALVYFSEYEGFGMPPVEAVLHGACPVYSALPATQEVMDGGGAPFENASFDSFAAAMALALRTPRSELVRMGERLQQRFSWPVVADRVVHALKAHSAAS